MVEDPGVHPYRRADDGGLIFAISPCTDPHDNFVIWLAPRRLRTYLRADSDQREGPPCRGWGIGGEVWHACWPRSYS
jgi:hypothetical protein